jgi:hypothetical protein
MKGMKEMKRMKKMKRTLVIINLIKKFIMSVFYNKVERGNPMYPEAAKKWYVVLRRINQIGEKEVAKLIYSETIVT